MQATTDIYVKILKRVMGFADTETKKELAGIIIKEFITNHTGEESADLEFEPLLNDQTEKSGFRKS